MAQALALLIRALETAIARLPSDVMKEVLRALRNFVIFLAAQTGSVLVLRQDEPNPSGNVFRDWASLYAVLSTMQGFKWIAVDPSINPIAQVPAGTYQLEGVTIQGLSAQIAPTLNLQSGATLVNVAVFRQIFVITNRVNAAAAPALIWTNTPTLATGGPPLCLFETAFLSGQTPFPGLLVDGASGTNFVVIELRAGGTLGDRNNPSPIWAVARAQNGGGLQVVGFDQSSVLNNWAESDAGSSVFLQYSDDCNEIPSATPTNVLGSYGQSAMQFQPTSTLYADALFGSDTIGNGTVRRPFASLGRCLQVAQLNNTQDLSIKLAPGTYQGVTISLAGSSLQRLSIEGPGGVRSNLCVINGSPNGVEIVPTTQAEADQFVSLVLRNLLIQAPQYGLLLTDFTVNPTNFLNDGLEIDNCQIQGDFEAISLYKVSRVDCMDSYVGQATMDQCAGQRWSNLQCDSTITINTTLDNAMPFSADQIQAFYGCRIFDIELTFQPRVVFDQGCSCDILGTSLLQQSAAGLNPLIHFHGEAQSAFINTAEDNGTAVDPAIYDLDFAKILSLTAIDVLSTTPPQVTTRQGILAFEAGGAINLSGNLNLDARKASFPEAAVLVLGAATVDSDTRTATSVTGGAGAVPVLFPFPFPAAAIYNVLVESDSAISAGITNKTGAGFDQTGSAAGANLNLTAIRS